MGKRWSRVKAHSLGAEGAGIKCLTTDPFSDSSHDKRDGSLEFGLLRDLEFSSSI